MKIGHTAFSIFSLLFLLFVANSNAQRYGGFNPGARGTSALNDTFTSFQLTKNGSGKSEDMTIRQLDDATLIAGRIFKIVLAKGI